MASYIRRRKFLATLGGAAAWPLAARAQQSVPVIGLLHSASPEAFAPFLAAYDPVGFGLVTSLNRPGSNVTGVSLFTSELEVKRFALLRELAPTIPRIAMLVNPNSPTAEPNVRDVQAAANAVGQHFLRAGSERDIDSAFRTMVGRRTDALLVAHDPFLFGRREQLVALAAYTAIPAIYEFREFVLAGGLMSYGSKLTDNYRLAGGYAGKILRVCPKTSGGITKFSEHEAD